MIRIPTKDAAKIKMPDHLRGSVPGPGKKAAPAKSRKLAIDEREDTAQQAFVKWAATEIKSPCRVYFVPNGLGKLGRTMASWATKMGLTPGVSDIHVMWPGGMGFIEFKSKTGALTGYQEAFLSDAKACGHFTGIARSKDDGIALLKAWGCLPDAARGEAA